MAKVKVEIPEEILTKEEIAIIEENAGLLSGCIDNRSPWQKFKDRLGF